MAVLEFHGRLPDPPAPGSRADLDLALFPTAAGGEALWWERQRGVVVHDSGSVHLILGAVRPLPADLFDRFPRWLAVARAEASAAPRVPLLGAALRLDARLAALEAGRPGGALSARVDQLERRLDQQASATRRLRDGFDHLHGRLTALHDDPWREQLRADLAEVAQRLDGLAGDRLQRIEDELEDLVGPGGDVVDLHARLEAVQAAIGAALPALRRLPPDAPPDPEPDGD